MKRTGFRVLIAPLAILSIAALPACDPGTTEDDPDREAAGVDAPVPVRTGPAEEAATDLRQRFLAAETPEGRAALFTSDGFLLLDETEILEGREDILAYYQRTAEDPQPRIEFDPIEAEASGSLALERGRFTQAFRAAEGDDVARIEGKYLLVLRLDAEEGWRIRGAVMQSEEPPPHRRNGDRDDS